MAKKYNTSGIVRSIRDSKAQIFIKRSSMCGSSCQNCENICGSGETLIWAKNTVNASVGDDVTVSLNEGMGFLAAFLVYGIPLLIMVIGVIVLFALKVKQDIFLLIPLGGAVLWFGGLYLMQKKGYFSMFDAEVSEIQEKGEF